jgi:hypothetical protein
LNAVFAALQAAEGFGLLGRLRPQQSNFPPHYSHAVEWLLQRGPLVCGPELVLRALEAERDRSKLRTALDFLTPQRGNVTRRGRAGIMLNGGSTMSDRCVAASLAGFIQELAVSCVAHGYFFYVTGEIPPDKDPVCTDEKIITRYGIGISRWARCRRKRAGLANVRFLRHGPFFVIIATQGEHPFFTDEAGQIHDIRRRPIRFAGYSVGCGKSRRDGSLHVSVRIHREVFSSLKEYFRDIAVHRPAEIIGQGLRALPFEPYAPVRNQLRILLRAVNRRRKAAGLELVPWDAIPRRRVPVKPFSPR